MSESSEAFVKIDRILRHVMSLDGQTGFLVRAIGPDLLVQYCSVFRRKTRAIKVFQLVDGKRSVGEIAKALKMHQPNVSKEMAGLEEAGLVSLTRTGDGKSVYVREKICKILALESAFARLLRNGKTKPNTPHPKSRKR